MGLLARMHAPTRVRRTGLPGFTDDFWYVPAGWVQSVAETGVSVTPDLLLTLSALWSGVTFMARNLASLPCAIYERLDDEDRQKARAHPIYDVLRWQPNEVQTAMDFWEMVVGHVLLRGTAYARIVDGRRGPVDQLVPIHPDRLRPELLPNGRVRYKVQQRGPRDPEHFVQEEIFRVTGFSSDGLTGRSLAEVAGRSLGGAIAADRAAARFFKSGMTASVVVKSPDVLGDTAQENLRRSIANFASGPDNYGGVLVLEDNLSIDKIGINPQEAQLLSTREHAVREIARWLGLPVHVLADPGTNPTYASVEMFFLHLVTNSFRPLAVRIEQCVQRDLIVAKNRFYAEFLMDALLRGDMKARAEFYRLAVMSGWMTRNEVRRKENLNRGPDDLDKFLEPMNMARADERDLLGGGSAGAPTKAQGVVQGQRTQAQLATRFSVRSTLLAYDTAMRVLRREKAAASAAAKKYATDGEGWAAWTRSWYEEHAVHVAQILRVPLDVAREYAARQGEQLATHGVGVMEGWEFTVPADLAALALGDRETTAALIEAGG